MSAPPRNEQQHAFLRQAGILRKNLNAWEATLRSQHGEDWPKMLGRLNAAFNQAGNLDHGIEDSSEHFVYVPKKCTVNAQDLAFFLSTRLVTAAGMGEGGSNGGKEGGARAGGGVDDDGVGESQGYGEEEPATRLRRYEGQVAELASEFEDGMVRF